MLTYRPEEILHINRIERFLEVTKTLPLSKDGPWLVGGAIRRAYLNWDESDYDIFFSSKEQHQNMLRDIKANKIARFDCIRWTKYTTVNLLIQNLGFTINQFVYDGIFIYIGNTTLKDISEKKLYHIENNYIPQQTLFKYLKQGYTLTKSSWSSLKKL